LNKKTFIYALLHPLNLAVLAVAAAAGACSAWWLFPIGVVIWLIMIMITVRDPRLRMILLPESHEPLAQRFQERFTHIEQARISVFNSLESAQLPVRRALAPAQKELDDLVNQAYLIFKQMSALENNRLVNQMNAKSGNTLTLTEQKLASATDPNVKRDLEEARQALEKRQVQLTSLSTVLDRADAQFSSLVTSVDGIVTRFINMQAVKPDQAKLELPKLLDMIRTEQAGLNKFAQEVNQATALA
jgi:hypothetical protein